MITKIIKTRGPSFPLVGQMNTNFSTKLKKFSIISTRQTMTIDWLRSTSPLTQVNGGVDLLLREREGVPSRPGSNNSPYKANPEVRTKYETQKSRHGFLKHLHGKSGPFLAQLPQPY